MHWADPLDLALTLASSGQDPTKHEKLVVPGKEFDMQAHLAKVLGPGKG